MKMTKNEIAETVKLIEQTINDDELKVILLDAGQSFYDYVFKTPSLGGADFDKKRTEELESALHKILMEDAGCRFIDRVMYKGKFSGKEKVWLRFAEIVDRDFVGSVGHMFNVFALFYKMSSDICHFIEKYSPMMG